MTGDSLYLKNEGQKEYQDSLRKGEDFIKKLRPDARQALEDALKSGNPEYIAAMANVFLKRGVNPEVIKSAFDGFKRSLEFQKKQGVKPSESVAKVSELIEKKLAEIKPGN